MPFAVALSVSPRLGGPRDCPYCFEGIDGGRRCPQCATRYHPECATALRTCALLGCPGLLVLHIRGVRRRVRRRRWPWVLACATPVLFSVVVLAAADLVEARRRGNETAAIRSFGTLGGAHACLGSHDCPPGFDYGTLEELAERDGLTDRILGSGTKQGYAFEPDDSTAGFFWGPGAYWMAVSAL